MVSVRVAQYADLAGRAVVIAVFAFVATNKIALAITLLQEPEGRLLDLVSHFASVAFVSLIVVMTLFRLKPIRSAEGIEPRISALVGTCLGVSLPLLPPAVNPVPLQVTALVLILIGWTLSTYVLLFLGRSFSIMAQARSLVTHGPYAFVRHPLYLSEEIATVGIAINFLSIEAVLIVAVQWLFQLRRMTNEEQVLRASFPEYEAYAKHTPKVIPRLFPKPRFGHA
jgi:protein-S-isoprenylcysteine O-methyltransferase Ste14